MQLIPAKTPKFITWLFPNYIWNIDTKTQELFLTFDDGPTPDITNWVLNLLKEYNAKATFFCIGNNIEKHPEIFQNIIAEGHTIGNHTYNHINGWKHKTEDYISDVLKTQKVIEHFGSSNTFGVAKNSNQKASSKKHFRPPYGKLKSKQATKLQELGYKIIMWDVLSFDWDTSVSDEKCLKKVIDSSKKGSIIVFHDSKKAEQNLKYALPMVLEYYSKMGFTFKSLNSF